MTGARASAHRAGWAARLGNRQPRWDVFYPLVFAAVLAIVLVDTPGSITAAGAAMAAMVPWYLFAGRPLWTGGLAGAARAAIYLTGLFALFAMAQSQNPDAWFLAFALSPQFFGFHPRLARGWASG